jgi:hypothetical protein
MATLNRLTWAGKVRGNVGTVSTLWTMDNIVALIDAAAPAPAKRGPYKKQEAA